MAAMGECRAHSPTRVFFVPPSRHLLCSLCDDYFNEVVLPCAGGHTFCRACVLRWFERQCTCPECRAAIPANAALLPNRLVRAMVDELRVRCRFGVKEEGDGWVADETGCPAQLSLDGAAAHAATCGFATIVCPFAGCGVELRRDQTDAHDATFAVAHARGERAARLAGEAAMSSRLEVATAAMASRIAALEARVFAAPVALPVAQTPSDGWAVRHTIHAADDQDEGNLADSAIWCCAFSPDSRYVCIALEGGVLKPFDIATGDYQLKLEGHEEGVNCCAFSPDGSTIVSASDDNTVMLWNAASGAFIRMLEGHTHAVYSCAFSPDGRSICSGCFDKSLKLWDVATGQCQRTLDGHAGWVLCCAYSTDGATVLSGSYDVTLKLWSVTTGACIRTFNGHTGDVVACRFNPTDGKTILSCSGDNTLKLWDTSTGVCRRTLIGHTGSVRGCAFSPIHGNLLLSCSADKHLKLWDAATGACTATLEGHETEVYCCAFSPDGASIASGDARGKLKLWRRA